MCGIAGAFSINQEDKNIVHNIINFQQNRGPDYSKTETNIVGNYFVTIGNNRLSINDLTPSSHQPFWDESKNFCITFNGEIYNYVELKIELINKGVNFSTSGDTEVLLKALILWGEEAISKLNGMFAFCFIDFKKRKAILSRDRFSKKPLYYYYNNNKFIFASTPTEIAKSVGSGPNFYYLLNGLNYWIYENGSAYSQYDKILSLQGGKFIILKFENSTLDFNVFEYYNLAYRLEKSLLNNPIPLNYLEAKSKVFDLFKNAVQIRLRSDVPVAVALSGGLDSSSIAALAKLYNPDIQGITFGNPNSKKSEGPVVSRLATFLGMKVNYVWPTKKEIISSFEKSLKSQDSPIASQSYLAEYLVYQRAKELGFKVMLGGQGGDEIFMGYRKYQFLKLINEFNNRKIVGTIRQSLSILLLIRHELFQLRKYIQSLKRYSSNSGISTILDLGIENNPINLNPLSSKSSVLMQIKDILESSVPTQVKSEDRNSMANSIETRAPLLDYRLVEYGVAMPLEFKINNGYGKYIIRDAIKGMIPDEIRLAKFKRGYDVSQDWVSMGIGDYLRERIGDNESILKPFFKKGVNVSVFSNEYFRSHPAAFQEAATLIWLSDHL